MSVILPPVPSVPKVNNIYLTRFLNAIKTIIETREGTRASGLYKHLTLEDIQNINFQSNRTIANVINNTIYDGSAIAAPTGFTVSKQTYYHYLSWTNPNDSRLSHHEIYWNTSNDLSSAELLALVTAPQNYFRNLIILDFEDRYYWIRARTFGGGYSPWRPIDQYGDPEGFLVEADETVGVLIDQIMTELRDLPQGSELPLDSVFKAGDIDGVPTVGLSGDLVVDGTILARHIAADQITAGHIAADQIDVDHLNLTNAFVGMTIQSNNFVTETSGWQILKTGDCEFNAGTFRGTLGAGIVTADSVGTNEIIAYSGIFGVKPPINATRGIVFEDDFSVSWDETDDWFVVQGYGERYRLSNAAAVTGSHFMQYGNNSGTDRVAFMTKNSIPFDPTALYRMKIRARANSTSTVENMGMYGGFIGRNLADDAYIDRQGGTVWNNATWFCMREGAHPKNDTWIEYVGYLRGTSGTEDNAKHPYASAPGTMYTGVKWIRPILIINSANGAGIAYIDQIVVEKVPDAASSEWADANDATYIDGGNIYTGSLNASRITAGTITTDRLIGAAITTSGASYAASTKAPDSSSVIVCQVAFTTTGAPVVLIASSLVTTPEAYTSGYMDLRMDYETPLIESEDLRPTNTPENETVSFVYRHTPSAASHTWKFRLFSESSNDIYAKNAGLVVMELKR